MYTCGITPYDTTHLGHAFTYTSVDILVRYLEYLGSRVRYVQNVTDIDDDLLKRAGETGEDWILLGNRWSSHFIDDMVSLNVRPPDVLPRATDVIQEIISAVARLVDCGVAYVSGGSVYYAIDRFEDYGNLSKLSYEEMGPIAAERGNKPGDPHKRDPLDFVLWQAQALGEPAWESPWGPGRPGWHIECSTMADKYLGNTLDVHAGGSDLIYPHHESEIAQAEACDPMARFVRQWMHVAMVHHEGEKMSKSLGNLVMVRDLLEDWTADTLRLVLASHHYREVWAFDPAELKAMAALEGKLRHALSATGGPRSGFGILPFVDAFERAMESDLDSPRAISALESFSEGLLAGASQGLEVGAGQDRLRILARTLGLLLDQTDPEAGVTSGWAEHALRFQWETIAGKE